MKIKILSLLIAGLFIPCISAQTQAEDSKELKAYIENIRKWRMSERARGSLRSLAGVLTENTIMTFPQDEATGIYYKSYRNTSCMNPNMDPDELKRMKEEYELKIGPIVLKLQPLADTDNSGFVTTEEGAHFRNLVEFGYQATYVASKEDPDSKYFLIGMNMDKDRFKERISEYKELVQEARTRGIDLPEPGL